MSSSRLTSCLDDSSLTLPEGQVIVYGARADSDIGALPRDRVHIIQPQFPDFSALSANGWTCAPAPEGDARLAIVFLPRARDLARAWIRDAAARVGPEGPIVIDGQKTDGVEAMLKACRARATLGGQTSKAHGKIFWFTGSDGFTDWPDLTMRTNADGYQTAPGVFSADGIDPASRLLADNLPEKLGAHVADLGAGWGYLATRILTRNSVSALHLVEADHMALDCARANMRDPRAQFHWADARNWRAPAALDTVVMNPPFHQGRKAEPDLGRAFISAAARNLKPSGQLWLVANRHLPYETALDGLFARVEERGGDNRFKLLLGEKVLNAHRSKGL